MSIEERLDFFDRHFDFRNHPEDFNFETNPERVVYRNEALRTGNRSLYLTYLIDHYPEELAREMETFDADLSNLVHISADEARNYLNARGYNTIESDFAYDDDEAVFFNPKSYDNETQSWHIENNAEDLIRVTSTVNQALFNKEFIYLIK